MINYNLAYKNSLSPFEGLSNNTCEPSPHRLDSLVTWLLNVKAESSSRSYESIASLAWLGGTPQTSSGLPSEILDKIQNIQQRCLSPDKNLHSDVVFLMDSLAPFYQNLGPTNSPLCAAPPLHRCTTPEIIIKAQRPIPLPITPDKK